MTVLFLFPLPSPPVDAVVFLQFPDVLVELRLRFELLWTRGAGLDGVWILRVQALQRAQHQEQRHQQYGAARHGYPIKENILL